MEAEKVNILGYALMNGIKSKLRTTNVIVEKNKLEDYKKEIKDIFGVKNVFLYYTENLNEENFLEYGKKLKKSPVIPKFNFNSVNIDNK